MPSNRSRSGGQRKPHSIDLGRAKVGAVRPPANALRAFDEHSGQAGRYFGDPLGMPALRERFASVLRATTGWAPPIEHIAVIDRSSAVAIAFFFETALTGGPDEILSWLPQWFGYHELLPDGQMRPEYTGIRLGAASRYRPSTRSVKKHLNADVGAVIVPDLINPLGVRISDARLRGILKTIYQSGEAMVLHDNHFLFNVHRPNRSVYSLCPALWNSGRYVGVTSLRLGFALPDQHNVAFCWGPRPWILAFGEFLRLKHSRPDIPRQLLALACLQEEGLETPKAIRRVCETNREILDEWLQRVPEFSLFTPPEDGPHVTLNLEKALDAVPAPELLRDVFFLLALFREKKVSLLPTSQFGLRNPGARINLSAAGNADFTAALKRIESFVRGRPCA